MFTPCARRKVSKVVEWHALVVTLATLAAGCASAAAAVQTSRATSAVERARRSGAAQGAPYEMALAQAYLDKAREESSQAQYDDAIRFAKRAREQADLAVENQREPAPGVPGQGATP